MSVSKKGIRVFLISTVAFALVFCGIQFIQAQQIKIQKKPVKPDPVEEGLWQVSFVEPYYSGNATLKGLWDNTPFLPDDYTQVSVSGPSRQCPCYGFRLRISQNEEVFSPGIDFDGITIPTTWSLGENGVPCGFPYTCEEGVPNCVACFLNDNIHPADGYKDVLLRFQIDRDALDNIELDTPTLISDCGYLHISFYSEYSYEVPPPGIIGYHGLYSFTTVQDLLIQKNSDGSWALEFNQPLEDLVEHYSEQYTYYKGNKEKIGTRNVQPLTVTTNPVHFKMIFTKQ
ncbi:MAG: hypothetical protein ABIN18_23520 [Pseudomonadota bacterium]